MLKKLRALTLLFVSSIQDIFSDVKEIWNNREEVSDYLVFFIFFIPLFTIITILSFGLFLFACIVIVTCSFFKCIPNIYTFAQNVHSKYVVYFQPKQPLSQIYSQAYITEVVCKILQNNAKELGIVSPSSIVDILPTQYPVLRIENGFGYYNFIVQCTTSIDEDLEGMQTLLDLKISQFLQAYCSNYQILYNDIPVIKVFRVTNCLYHANCLSVCIMLIDSDEKYNYIRHLAVKARNLAVSMTPKDEDF